MARSFEDLLDEAEAAPNLGWDFSWLDGRAYEQRPSWRYFDRVAEAVRGVGSMLDIQTGTGGMIRDLPELPPLTVATDGYEPNAAIASEQLRARGAHFVRTDESRAAIPFVSDTFELIISRHPVDTWWGEIARTLRPGGTYLSQQVGPDSLRALSELLMGPLPTSSKRDPSRARRAAEDAGLVVTDLRAERLTTRFLDIGAVVYFLRLVVWIVPDFTVARYRERLRALHEQIEGDGELVATASRFLIAATKRL